MASGMMSHYPEKFKAGAVIAGVPYPCADNLVKAIACMKSGPADKPELLAKRIKRSNEALPKLVVITGDSDPIVAPKNSEFLAKQWVALNGLDQNSGHSTKQNAVEYIHWPSSENSVVELIRIKELGHGIPVNPTITGGGVEAPFYLNSTFSAAEYLASAWF
jgi:poly(3-hydroxybutyrate) depolymerase